MFNSALECTMTGSYTSEQQVFLKPTTTSEHTRPERADLSEREAIQRAQRGDADGFEHLYHSYCRRVYALCLRMVGNRAEAEDLTQETFLTVLRKIRTFRGEAAFSTWLHRIAVNLVLMRVRRKTLPKISREFPDECNRGGPSEEFSGTDLHLAGSIDRVHLERAIEKLAPCHKVVVQLHDIQGYKHKEIAQIMDWSVGNSKARLHRARRRLRELLRKRLHLIWAPPVQATQATLGGR
jgi:RNA polymerase sigma-70 factor, ECF subfamily